MSKRKPTAPIESDLWRSVEEQANPEAAAASVVREFPDGASELDGTSRREFMQLVGGTLALAGVGTMAGCKDPPQKILPYNLKPADVVPGRPLHYATTLTHGGVATAVLATAWEGRPTKIEGNPEHPLNKGSSSSFDQAAILSLYDDTRAKEIKEHGTGRSWKQFCRTIDTHAAGLKGDGGSKLAFLVEPSASPLLASLQKRIAAAFPKARWYAHAPLAMDEASEGARIAFGRPLDTQYDLTKAKIVVSFDADFLGGWPMWLAQQRQWAERRAPGNDMSRLYVGRADADLHRHDGRPSPARPLDRPGEGRARAPRRGHGRERRCRRRQGERVGQGGGEGSRWAPAVTRPSWSARASRPRCTRSCTPSTPR